MGQIKSVLLWKNQRRFVREALDDGTLRGAIVPIGSTEQHNEHLAMEHDTASAVHISRLVAERLFPQVIVTTPLAIGVSEHWMDHKGTLTLRPEVFGEVLYDVCDNLRRHGIRRVLILNGHAGNIVPVRERLDDFRRRLGIHLEFCSYWEAYTPEFVQEQMESNECPGHASEFETSFALAAFPENVDWNGVDYERAKLTISNPEYARQDRLFHAGAKLATAAKGQAMIQVAVDWVTTKMRRLLEEE
jgi:creatinine amidohydrolase